METTIRFSASRKKNIQCYKCFQLQKIRKNKKKNGKKGKIQFLSMEYVRIVFVLVEK